MRYLAERILKEGICEELTLSMQIWERRILKKHGCVVHTWSDPICGAPFSTLEQCSRPLNSLMRAGLVHR
jgi:hypothetical protein